MASKSVILLDFDNIFLGLWSLDRDLAVRFASEPKVWLQALNDRYLIEDRRRWLVARCYLNPNGWVQSPGETNGRLFFSRFRPLWVATGFEVIDTPTLARANNKNAADIRMVIDALDLMQHAVRFDEFVIASGDSDFTPLLQRLRAGDRQITVMSPGNASSAYTTLADKVLDLDAIDALLRPEQAELAAPIMPDGAKEAADPMQQAFAELMLSQYQEATGPIHLAALAQLAARQIPGIRDSKWLGEGTFTNAVERLELPHAVIDDLYLWDEERHQGPVVTESFLASDLPEAVEVLSRTIDMPRLGATAWPAVFEKLAEYAATHEFNLTDSTKWTRDALAAAGIPVGRAALNYVVRGAQFGGAPLTNKPPPSADDIANAFLSNLVTQAYSAGVVVDKTDEDTIAGWLGLSEAD